MRRGAFSFFSVLFNKKQAAIILPPASVKRFAFPRRRHFYYIYALSINKEYSVFLAITNKI